MGGCSGGAVAARSALAPRGRRPLPHGPDGESRVVDEDAVDARVEGPAPVRAVVSARGLRTWPAEGSRQEPVLGAELPGWCGQARPVSARALVGHSCGLVGGVLDAVR